MSSGCKHLANAVKELTKLPLEQQTEALKTMTNLQCVECTQTADFNNIIAGESVNIGDINQIMSCGIGNSGGTEMIEQLKKFIDEKEVKINTNLNNKVDNMTNKTDEKINKNYMVLYKEIKKITQIGGIITSILFTLIFILIIMKIIGI
jgi:hypothetical protein